MKRDCFWFGMVRVSLRKGKDYKLCEIVHIIKGSIYRSKLKYLAFTV